MPFKRKTGKRLDFPFLKTKSFNQSFWNNLSQNLGVVYDEFGPLPITIKSQNVENLKTSPCSLDCVWKILDFWSFKTFFIFSFLAFFLLSFTITGLHIAIPSVNTNLKDTGYSF